MSPRLLAPLVLAAVALLAGCGSSDAGASPEGRLEVREVTVDEPVVPDQAIARFVIDNGAATPDVLRSASSPVAERVTVHESVDEGGVATMVARDSVPVAAGATVTFAPGGLHVMMEGLERDLAVGDRFPLTLTFDRAGEITVTAAVVPLGTAGTAPDTEHDHG